MTSTTTSSPSRIFYTDDHVSASLTVRPSTTGHTLVNIAKSVPIFSLDVRSFKQTLLSTRYIASIVQRFYKVRRCALVTNGSDQISVLPLHGLDERWKPILDGVTEYHESYPGYISSKDAPMIDRSDLEQMGERIRRVSNSRPPFDYTFLGDTTDQNLFARLLRGEIPQTRVWEDEKHVAFLTPFANTPGFTVLIPRRHLSSDVFSLNDTDFVDLVEAAHTVGQIFMKTFELERCGMIFEGFEIDYTHVKLIPIHESRSAGEMTRSESAQTAFSHNYTGSVNSLPGPVIEDEREILERASELRSLIETR